MSSRIMSGVIDLSVDAKGVNTGLADASKSVDNFTKKIKESGKAGDSSFSTLAKSAKKAADDVVKSEQRMISEIQKKTNILNAGGSKNSNFYANQAKSIGSSSQALQGYIQRLREAESQGLKTSKALGGLGSLFSSGLGRLGLAGGAGVALLGGVKIADEYTLLTAKLKIATSSQEEYAQALDNVRRISTASQSDLSASATLYTRLTNNLRDFNVTQQQIADIAETVALGLKVQGASTEEAAAGMLQLSQAFAKGKLDGDEFKSLAENAPILIQRLADSLGLPKAALFELSSQGQLTNDVLIKAFTNPEFLKGLRDQAKEVQTITGAWKVFTNQFDVAIGKINETTGASKILITVLEKAATLLSVFEGGEKGSIVRNIIDNRNKDLRAEFETMNNSQLKNQKSSIAQEILAARIKKTNKAPSMGLRLNVNNFAPDFSSKIVDGKKVPLKEDGQGGYDARQNEDFNAKKIAKQITDYQRLTRSINEKIAANQQELIIGKPLTDSEKQLAEIIQQRADGTIKLSKAEFDSVKAKLEKLALGDKELEQFKEQEKFYADFEASIISANKAVYDQIDAIEQQATDLEFQNEVYGKLPSAITDVTIARLSDKKAMLESIGLAVDDIEEQIKAYKKLRQAQGKNEFLDSEKKRIEESQKAQEKAIKDSEDEAIRASENINRSLTDALLRGFESGKGFARNFRDTLVNLFKTLVLQPVVNFLVDSSGISKILGAVTGGLSSAANASSGGGLMSSLSGIGDLFQRGNSALIGSIESLGTFLSTGTGGLGDLLGGALGQYAGQIANVLPFAGVGLNLLQGNVKGALGSALGAALSFTPLGPVGGLIGSLVGGSLFGGKKQPPRTVTALPEVNQRFIDSLTVLTKGFGIDSNISANARYSGRSGGSGYGFLDASVNGVAVNEGIRYKGAYGEATMKQFIDTVLTGSIKRAIATLELPEGIKKFFTGLTKQEEIADAINTLVTFKAQLKDLPPIFNSIKDAMNTTSYQTSIADLKARFEAIGTYTNLFYSAEENFATFTKQLTSQFTELNQTLPETRDGFRSLVDGLMNDFSETGRTEFNGLVALAPAADTYYKNLLAQKAAIDQVNQALADGLDRNLYSTFADFASAQATVASGGIDTFTARYSSPTAMNEALLAEIKLLREENANMRITMEAVATYTQETSKIQKRWNGDGLPETRVIE